MFRSPTSKHCSRILVTIIRIQSNVISHDILLKQICLNSGTSAVTMLQIETGAKYPGLSFTAAGLMAMKHFNERDSEVVPELADLNNCNIQFDFNRTRFIDTGSVTHEAAKSFLMEHEKNAPSAMVGTFNNVPASDISTMFQGRTMPMYLEPNTIPLLLKYSLIWSRAHKVYVSSC
jgi:hypothetical protein